MHVTACLAGQDDVEVEVGEGCRSLQALKEAVVVALPQLCVEGFDVCVGGRALDDDEGVVSLVDSVALDVVPNTRGLSVLALREAGREVSEKGLLAAAQEGDVSLCTLYLDAGVSVDCSDYRFTPFHLSCLSGSLSVATLLLDRGSAAIDAKTGSGWTPLHYSCHHGHLENARLLLDRGSTAIDEKGGSGWTPLHHSCRYGKLEVATLLLDRGSTAIDEKTDDAETPLHLSCFGQHLALATLLLDRGSTAIDEKNAMGETPLHLSCRKENLPLVTLLLDRGCSVDVEACRAAAASREVLELLLERGHGVLPDAAIESAKRRRISEL